MYLATCDIPPKVLTNFLYALLHQSERPIPCYAQVIVNDQCVALSLRPSYGKFMRFRICTDAMHVEFMDTTEFLKFKELHGGEPVLHLCKLISKLGRFKFACICLEAGSAYRPPFPGNLFQHLVGPRYARIPQPPFQPVSSVPSLLLF